MKYNEIVQAIRENKKLTTTRCVECGAESILYFGFSSPCQYNNGSHQKFEEVETTLKHEINKVKANYSCCMWFDREKFDNYVSDDIKKIIWSEE